MHFKCQKSIFANLIQIFNGTTAMLCSISEKIIKHPTIANIVQARAHVLKIFYFCTSIIVTNYVFPLHKALILNKKQ